MAIPDVSITTKDFALGIVATDGDRLHAKVGSCSGGTAYTPVLCRDPKQVRDNFGFGPLVEAVCFALNQPNAGGVIVCKATTGTAGANGSVTDAGTGTATVTVAGAPYDSYDAVIVITAAGANLAAGTAKFKYTLDGGRTYSDEYVVPTGGTYAIPNTNVTATFVDGTFVVGDTHSWTSTQPAYSTTNMGLAVDAILAMTQEVGFIHLVGAGADASATAAIISALDTKLQAATGSSVRKWTHGMVECPAISDALLYAATDVLSSDRVEVVGRHAYLTSAVSGTQQKRPAAWVVAARKGAIDPAEDPARVRTGPIPGVVALVTDERVTEALDAHRISTLRTHVGRSGFFITNSKMLSATGSDFKYSQHRRILDIACAVSFVAGQEYLSEELEVDAVTGLLTEWEARSIEAFVEGRAKLRLIEGRKRVSSLQAIVDRTVNVTSTETIKMKLRVQPKAYPKQVEVEVAFFNPRVALT